MAGSIAKISKSKKDKKKKKRVAVQSNEGENIIKKSRVAEEDKVHQISSGDDDCSKGMKKWITKYHQSRPGLQVLQQRIDEFIVAHEEKLEQVRGMTFVKDVRRQLSQIMQKIARDSLDVQANGRRKESQQGYRKLRKALCIGFAGQLAERMMHHNGYRTVGFKSQLVQVHPSSVLCPDEDGLFPYYVVYHELIATSRPYMRNVCAVEMRWVTPILKKLESLNVSKLSGGSGTLGEGTEEKASDVPKKDVAADIDDRNSKIQAARERFLARKGTK